MYPMASFTGEPVDDWWGLGQIANQESGEADPIPVRSRFVRAEEADIWLRPGV
jgi:hypothetical protein